MCQGFTTNPGPVTTSRSSTVGTIDRRWPEPELSCHSIARAAAVRLRLRSASEFGVESPQAVDPGKVEQKDEPGVWQQSVPGLRVSPHGEFKAAKRNQKGQCPEKTVARTPAAEESHIPGLICNQDGQRASSATTVTPVDAPGQHVPKHEGNRHRRWPRTPEWATANAVPQAPKPSQCPCADEGISKQGRCTAGRAAHNHRSYASRKYGENPVTSAKNDDQRPAPDHLARIPGRNEDARKGQP